MSIDENKTLVRQFIKKVLMDHDVDAVDKLVAANYVNRGMGNADLAGFKSMLSAMSSAKLVSKIEIEDLVAEGDSVVFRGKLKGTTADGKQVTARGITFYRLVNGKIVEDDPVFIPDLAQILGSILQPKSNP
jgi:predicted ester cyclase